MEAREEEWEGGTCRFLGRRKIERYGVYIAYPCILRGLACWRGICICCCVGGGVVLLIRSSGSGSSTILQKVRERMGGVARGIRGHRESIHRPCPVTLGVTLERETAFVLVVVSGGGGW